MPRNPLLGIQKEDEEIVETGPEAQAEEPEEEISEEEAEESEETSDEDESDEEEIEEEKPAPKKQKASAKPSSKAVKASKEVTSEAGTLGDARIDESIPMSAKATVYLGLLLKSPIVPSIIPPDVLNEDSEHTFCINSLRIIVPKGRMVQVPFMLAEEIKQSFKNRF